MFNEDEKPEPQKESVVVDDSKPNEDEIEADSHSVLENVIPVKQISHGWKVIHGWMAVSCDDCWYICLFKLTHEQTKAQAINESEGMQKVNHAWTEKGAPVWDKSMQAVSEISSKTTEIVGQVVEKSSETVEKTKVMVGQVTADLQPAAAKVRPIITHHTWC
jgi:hypothetical protein